MALLQDFRFAIRQLKRTPGFTAAAVAVLSIGIGVNTAAFAVVNTLLLQPRPGRVDQVFAVFNRDRTKPDSYRDFSYPAYVDLRERRDLFNSLLAHSFSTVGIREGETTRRRWATFVSANYFSTLGVGLAAGRPFTLEDERPGARSAVAIASYAAWRRAGFDPAFIGRTVHVNAIDVTIVGIAPRGFGGTMTLVAFEWFFPLGLYDSLVNDVWRQTTTGLGDRGNHALLLAGALRPGVTVESMARPLAATASNLGRAFPATDRDRQFLLWPLPRLTVTSEPESQAAVSVVSGLLTTAAGLVLIVACINVANLLLARGAVRRREIAVRSALGGSRGRIVLQLLVEGFTLSAAAAMLGLAFTWLTTGAITAWLANARAMPLEIIVEPSFRPFVAAAACAVFSTLLFALGPAWAVSRHAAVTALTGRMAAAGRASRTAPMLVAAQLAVSLALVAAGGLFVRSAIRAASADPGFALDGQLIVSIDAGLVGYDETHTRALYRRIVNRAAALPGAARTALASVAPFGELTENRQAFVPGKTTPDLWPQFVIVSASYFDTLRLPILRGRGFMSADDEPPARRPIPAVVDVALSRRMFGDEDPLGRRIQVAVRESTPPVDFDVIGVVPTTRHDLFEADPLGHIYVPYGSQSRANMNLHVRTAADTGDAAMLATIRRELGHIDPRLPILTAQTMRTQRDRSFSEWSIRTSAALFSAIGALALVIAAIGVYGVRAYDVSRRRRELGIRIALGASSGSVIGLILRDGARTTAIGLTIGLALALGLGALVSSVLYQVSPFDPAVLVSAAAILTSAALLASYLPARQATRIEPLEALRAE